MTNLNKAAWDELFDILKKHKISYTTHYENRVDKGVLVVDKHVQINLVVRDYFEDAAEDKS